MNWEAIGAVGETIGAAGVIASLVYLAIQIRRQNLESKQNAVNNLTDQWNAFTAATSDNAELAHIAAKGLKDFDSLNDAELIQFSGHLNRMFRCYESMYRAHESRTLDDELWAGIHNAITDATTSPGIKAWWPTRSHWYSKSFANYVQELVTSDAEPVLRYARPND